MGDFVKEMEGWLATLGRVADAASQKEVIGIKQRLYELRDPRNESDPNYIGRLMSECNRFRRDFELRRHVMPAALKGESRSKDASRGGNEAKKEKQRPLAEGWDKIRMKARQRLAGGEKNADIAARLYRKADLPRRTVVELVAQEREDWLKK